LDYAIQPAKKFRGRWEAAGDKSITHRAFLFNAMAQGSALVRNASPGEDCGRTRRILEQLGARITPEGRGAWRVEGSAGRFAAPAGTLDAGNSGTTMRLVAGLLAGQPFRACLDGDASLRRRPMDRIRIPLEALGAKVETGPEGCPPVTVQGGPLAGCAYESPVASAQVKGAFLLGALAARGASSFKEPQRSRDHSERLLRRMGARIEEDGQGRLRLEGPQALSAVDVTVPGDLSSAAFLIAGGLLVEGGSVLIKNLGVNPTRAGFLRVLERMGARFALYHPREEAGEPVADLLAQFSKLAAVQTQADEVPGLVDEIPILAVLAARAQGESRFRGLAELRVKESDRLARSAEMIQAFGGEARVEGDELVIAGGRPFKGAAFDAGLDHRLAMAGAIAALIASRRSLIRGAETIATSFPEFPSLIKRFSGDAAIVTEAG
jgi:3-phosphoshikimate 1-carboxyvinyltransferase